MEKNKHIYAVKMMIYKSPSSQDARFNDNFIGHILDTNRTFLLKKEFKKNKEDINNYYDYLCLTMEKTNALECGIDTDCMVMRSTTKIPKSIVPHQVLYINRKPLSRLNNNMLSIIGTVKRPFYYIYNDYIYLINIELENIILKYIPEEVDDEEAPDNICGCHKSTFYLPNHLTPMLYELTIKMMLSSNTAEDTKNDRKDETINVR